MHYYKFNIGDYRKDTGHLTPIEHHIYRTLIDWYYLDELPIPKETQTVIRRLGLGSDGLLNLQNILDDFFVLGESGWHHKRIDDEIAAYHEQSITNKVNGKLGGRPKKTQAVTNANRNESENNPNQEPITNNHKNIAPLSRLIELSVNKETAQDFLKTRKKALTDTAIKGIEREALKAGLSMQDAVTIACERGWQSFKADWVKDEKLNGIAWRSDDAQIIAKAAQMNISTVGKSRNEILAKIDLQKRTAL